VITLTPGSLTQGYIKEKWSRVVDGVS
jgi:hypothetical protein